ncbi:hypothetical protein ACFVYE_46495 [Streptomyces sp. NPDC058239]|uniref:hypothetical protein n=1 Tax=unclassified Streptomyces TaxID=2593676 RepID=UPI003662E633
MGVEQAWCARFDSLGYPLVQVVDLLGQVLNAAGQRPQGVAGSRDRSEGIQGFQLGAPLEQARVGQPRERLAQGDVGGAPALRPGLTIRRLRSEVLQDGSARLSLKRSAYW